VQLATVLTSVLCACLPQLFVRLGSNLMRGRTLRPEDLIDLLTLKANQAEDQVGDYATALDVLSRARVSHAHWSHFILLC
jgi:hypothetical protein